MDKFAEGWKEDLLKIIDADDLPAFLGGNKTDPDGNPLCNTFIIHGQKIPESYYLCNYEKKLSVFSDAKTLIVARSSKEEINFDVSKMGSLLEWEFETKNRDIDFSLYLKENELEDRVELIRKQRIDTCYDTEKGLFKCEKMGIYVHKQKEENYKICDDMKRYSFQMALKSEKRQSNTLKISKK
ncbi:SEC14-like protein 2 [Nephila pilipes]|uniref:SEC14-like protein 2 n=1 Tax=Nephila pilipes TaxID=299642 RepID=A0A8X6QTA0_NEPPI|nr:SEC14-like protein 2 [Nephila pilipes]